MRCLGALRGGTRHDGETRQICVCWACMYTRLNLLLLTILYIYIYAGLDLLGMYAGS